MTDLPGGGAPETGAMVRSVEAKAGWTAAVAKALYRNFHTIDRRTAAFAESGPKALVSEQSGGPPGQKAEVRGSDDVGPGRDLTQGER